MERIKLFIQKYFSVLLVFAFAIFLRLYRLPEFATFLSDQGSDAIVVKRIVTFNHLPAIGAASSVGQVYLGPFYYYLIAPFLPLFNFNPVGLALGVALLSIVGIFLTYIIVKKELSEKIAFIFLLLVSFSFVNIEVSRFSWNPNLLPFFSFLTLYFFYKVLRSNNLKSNKLIYPILFGAFFSFSFQLHYLSGLLFLTIFIFFLKELLTIKQKFAVIFRFFIAFFSFIIFSSPLVIFDLRHNFLNLKNFIKLFTEQGVFSHASLLVRFTDTIQSFFSNVMMSPISFLIAFFIFLYFILIYILSQRKHASLLLDIHFVNIFTYLFGFTLLNSAHHPHYYHSIYLSFFLVMAYILNELIMKSKSRVIVMLVTTFITMYIALNLKSAYFLFQKPNNQIKHAQIVANFLAEKIGNKPFNIATWPVEFFEDSYLYFLELKGFIPVDRSKLEITNQMFVLCNKEPCQVIKSASWNISMFGKSKIDKIWTVEGIKIYKLVHEN
ncbi:glycosyltransferase family 39 protein [Candidatus Roizmanbacteria bacterium]|nr:glycosyltransferase family 39 protein [Candidatus Roizmanbacteria bacterium]